MQEVRIWSVESYLYCDTDISDEQSYRTCVTIVTTLWNNAGTKPCFKKSIMQTCTYCNIVYEMWRNITFKLS